MYVYFIEAKTEPHRVKIGKAKSPEERLHQLQTGSAFRLRLVGKFLCKSDKHALEIEKSIHEILRQFRIEGEWFRFKPFVKLTIDQIVKHKGEKLKSSLRKARKAEVGYRLWRQNQILAKKDATP